MSTALKGHGSRSVEQSKFGRAMRALAALAHASYEVGDQRQGDNYREAAHLGRQEFDQLRAEAAELRQVLRLCLEALNQAVEFHDKVDDPNRAIWYTASGAYVDWCKARTALTAAKRLGVAARAVVEKVRKP